MEVIDNGVIFLVVHARRKIESNKSLAACFQFPLYQEWSSWYREFDFLRKTLYRLLRLAVWWTILVWALYGNFHTCLRIIIEDYFQRLWWTLRKFSIGQHHTKIDSGYWTGKSRPLGDRLQRNIFLIISLHLWKDCTSTCVLAAGLHSTMAMCDLIMSQLGLLWGAKLDMSNVFNGLKVKPWETAYSPTSTVNCKGRVLTKQHQHKWMLQHTLILECILFLNL